MEREQIVKALKFIIVAIKEITVCSLFEIGEDRARVIFNELERADEMLEGEQ